MFIQKGGGRKNTNLGYKGILSGMLTFLHEKGGGQRSKQRDITFGKGRTDGETKPDQSYQYVTGNFDLLLCAAMKQASFTLVTNMV